MAESQESFLGRWSRLKQDPDAPQSADQEGLTEVSAEPDSDEQAADLPALTDADMPAIETLDEASDYTGFWSEKVSEGLRRKALRKLFHLPEFNLRDGLNEYDEDYTSFEPLGDTVTYQMKQLLERQKAKLAESLEEDDLSTSQRVSEAELSEQATEANAARVTEEPIADPVDDEDELGCCEG